jgi:hypothetical protein
VLVLGTYIGFAEKVDFCSHSVDNQGYKLIKIGWENSKNASEIVN